MGMHALIEDTPGATLAGALEQASQWTLTAFPVIEALLAMESAHHGLYGHDPRVSRSAQITIGAAMSDLRQQLELIRSDAIDAATGPMPGTESERDGWHDLRDVLSEEVASVDDAVAKVLDL